MRRKRPHVASLDEVRITRHGDEAIIEYADERVWTTHLKLGPAVQHMTDEEILDRRVRGYHRLALCRSLGCRAERRCAAG